MILFKILDIYIYISGHLKNAWWMRRKTKRKKGNIWSKTL